MTDIDVTPPVPPTLVSAELTEVVDNERRTLEQAGLPTDPNGTSASGYTNLEAWLQNLARTAEGR